MSHESKSNRWWDSDKTEAYLKGYWQHETEQIGIKNGKWWGNDGRFTEGYDVEEEMDEESGCGECPGPAEHSFCVKEDINGQLKTIIELEFDCYCGAERETYNETIKLLKVDKLQRKKIT